jgi:hypothetical protein
MRMNCGQFITDTIIKITLKNETVLALTVVRIIKTQQDEALFMRAFLCLLETT